MKNILCKLGLHKWKESRWTETANGDYKYRHCIKCGKIQIKEFMENWVDC